MTIPFWQAANQLKKRKRSSNQDQDKENQKPIPEEYVNLYKEFRNSSFKLMKAELHVQFLQKYIEEEVIPVGLS